MKLVGLGICERREPQSVSLEDSAWIHRSAEERTAAPGIAHYQARDPSLTDIIDDVGVVRYMRNELGFLTDLRYQGPFGGGYPSPTSFRGDWMSVRWNWSDSAGQQPAVPAPPADSIPELQRVMRADSSLRVYTACGYYDLVCSYAVIAHMASQLEPRLARNVVVRAYSGGHAIYTDPAARLRMRDDVAKFIADALAARR